MNMSKLPLEGIRIIDMSIVWALPWTGAMLGEMGAEVIRLESLQYAPRIVRHGGLPRPAKEFLPFLGTLGKGYPDLDPGEKPWNRYAMFNALHRSKLSMTADITRPKGLEIFYKLVAVSDVFIENNAPGVMEKMGITWEKIHEVNPKMVYVRSSGYGFSGPYRDYSGFGMTLESVAGHSALRWYDNQNMFHQSHSYLADASAGAGALFATMLGLRRRRKTGEGTMVEIGLSENFISHLGYYAMDYAMNDRLHDATGNRDMWAVQGCYMCKGVRPEPGAVKTTGEDHWVVMTINNNEEWNGLCRAMGNPAWTGDEKFADQLNRMKNHDELDKLIEAWTSQHDKYEVMRLLQKESVPAGAVLNSEDVLNDPHLKERGWAVELNHPEAGTHKYAGPVWKMTKTPGHVFPAPCLGQDNEYVYKKILGVSNEEYQQLIQDEHIGDSLIGV
jgi:crotonobetainyl-CoA:carnitine CoA-transferase CaiB-like acyl-CoA transferase